MVKRNAEGSKIVEAIRGKNSKIVLNIAYMKSQLKNSLDASPDHTKRLKNGEVKMT